jgi:hypothetical protein
VEVVEVADVGQGVAVLAHALHDLSALLLGLHGSSLRMMAHEGSETLVL